MLFETLSSTESLELLSGKLYSRLAINGRSTFSGCPNMQTFCFGLLSTPMLKKVVLNHYGAHTWKGELNSTMEYLKGKVNLYFKTMEKIDHLIPH